MASSLGSLGMTAIGPMECPDADDVGAALDLAVHPFERVRGGDLGPMFAREGHVGQHVVAAGAQGAELGLRLAER